VENLQENTKQTIPNLHMRYREKTCNFCLADVNMPPVVSLLFCYLIENQLMFVSFFEDAMLNIAAQPHLSKTS